MQHYYHSPIGILRINVNEGYICEIFFMDNENKKKDSGEKNQSAKDNKILKQCLQQLDEYFEGSRKDFDFPFRQKGTPFQLGVWDELLNIPYGKTISYLQLSQRLGNVKAIRAVGTANGRNNLPIVVPCHRVIGSNGSLTGYGGGLWRKQWLLEHENKYAHGVALLF
jgi:methylated-DNA-[protein]-cysteine S-methyltransferase